MIRLFRWVFGYVKFSFTGGFSEDFLTECFAEGVEIRDVSLSENGFIAYCNLRTYKKLHRYALRHGGKVKVLKKYGLPFILLPLKNRMGFFVGMLVFAIIISFLSCFIWKVEIVGNNRISETAISAYLDNHNLKTGTMWSSVDRDALCWDIMSEFDDISWVHINKIGTTARVEINETKLADTEGNEDKLKGINVFRKELQVVAYREQKDMSVAERKAYKKLQFFSAEIPLYINKKTGDISEQSKKLLTIKSVTLPIGLIEYEECFLSSESKTLTDEELLNLAKTKMAYQEEKEFDG
ncbi:MAG: sporulation protein YqfD, partial [Eubacterium sp.]